MDNSDIKLKHYYRDVKKVTERVMKVFTWNTRGNFTKTDKLNVISDLFNTHGCRAGLIQEGGVGKAGSYGGVDAYSGDSVGAYNERCTNYVLVDKARAAQVRVRGLNTVGGGEAGRTAACVSVDWTDGESTRLVSWHSYAGDCNQDTACLFMELQTLPGRDTIIGSDFNTHWEEIDAMLARQGRYATQNVVVRPKTSGPATHISSNDYDFFVVMGNLAFRSFRAVECIGHRAVNGNVLSDHAPVVLDF